MSAAKHTPGPWFIRTNRHTSTDGRPWGWLDAAPPGGPQRNIPGVQVTWTRGEASEANARLIAAAPELLAALNAALDDVDAARADGYEPPAWAEAARAAIAKATGSAA